MTNWEKQFATHITDKWLSFPIKQKFLKKLASLVAQVVKNLPAMQETQSLIPELGRSPGEGNGNPLQYSCLENSTDRETSESTVYGVTKSQTRLSN